MKLKVMILVYMIQSFSLACAMHTNSTIMVCDNPPCANIVPMPFSPSTFALSTSPEKKSFLRKSEKSSAVDFWNPSWQTKKEWLMMCVEKAAQEKIYHREEEAAPMNNAINQLDIDCWRLLWLRGSGVHPSCPTSNVVSDLANIYYHFTPSQWTKDVLMALATPDSKAYNKRVADLLMRLAQEKKEKYRRCQIGGSIDFGLIKGSTVDEFFDEKILFPGLPKIFQQCVQQFVEKQYRHSLMKDNPSGSIVFHALLTALRNSNDDPQEIQALQESSTLKKYERDTKNAFAKYIAEHQDEIKPVDKHSVQIISDVLFLLGILPIIVI